MNAIPYYLLALLAYLLLISKWGIFPESGYNPLLTDGPVAWAKGLLLAWLVVGISSSTQYARFSRGSMIESMNEDYVRTARAKGLSERRVTLRHALRAAIVPVVTIFGLEFAYLLAGTIFTERIFDIQGIGLTAPAGDRHQGPADHLRHRADRCRVHRGRQPVRRHHLQRHRPESAPVMTETSERPASFAGGVPSRTSPTSSSRTSPSGSRPPTASCRP